MDNINHRSEQELGKHREYLEELVVKRISKLDEMNAKLKRKISERKRTEQELHESEQRYRLLVETLNDGLSVMDENGMITFTNEKFCEMLGCSRDELLGKPALELLDDDNRDILRVQRKQGKNAPYELTWTRKDGEKICTIISPSPQFDSKGRFKESITVVTDITARKQQEDELRESETRFQQLANATDDVFVVSDMKNLKVLYVNPAYEQIWGRSVQDLYEDPRQWDEGIHPDDRLGVQEAWVQMVDQGDRYEEVYRVLRPDGSIRWVRSRVHPLRDESGQVIRIMSFVQDITKHKQQDEELRESETRFQQLAEGIDDVFVLSDLKSKSVLYANPSYERIWGRSVQDLYDDYRNWDKGIHPDDCVRTQEAWAQVVKQGDHFEEEYRVLRPDGSMRWVRSRAYPLHDRSGQVYRVAEIVQDITAHKQAEEALHKAHCELERRVEVRTHDLHITNQALRQEIHQRKETELALAVAKEQAEAANVAKSGFLATMSHELRTPLNAIIGYSELLQEESLELGQEIFIPDLEKINNAGKYLLDLIDEILDLSKIEAGRMDLSLENVSIAAMLKTVVATVNPLMKKRGNTMQVKCAEDMGSLQADPTRLRQCLLNLLSNAAKFTERGRITLTVSRQPADVAQWVCFRVTDSGIGINQEHMDKIFEAFTQVRDPATGKQEGTGLGLAITRRLCRMMGGDVSVESELGNGSTFTLRLPAVVGERGADASRSGETTAARPDAST